MTLRDIWTKPWTKCGKQKTFSTLSPTALPTLHPHPLNLITIINFIFFFSDSILVHSIMSQRLVPSVTFLNESTRLAAH